MSKHFVNGLNIFNMIWQVRVKRTKVERTWSESSGEGWTCARRAGVRGWGQKWSDKEDGAGRKSEDRKDLIKKEWGSDREETINIKIFIGCTRMMSLSSQRSKDETIDLLWVTVDNVSHICFPINLIHLSNSSTTQSAQEMVADYNKLRSFLKWFKLKNS